MLLYAIQKIVNHYSARWETDPNDLSHHFCKYRTVHGRSLEHRSGRTCIIYYTRHKLRYV